MKMTHKTRDGRKLSLKVIPDTEVKNFVGETVSLASRGFGPHFVLKKVSGTEALIETPRSYRRDMVPVQDLRQIVEG